MSWSAIPANTLRLLLRAVFQRGSRRTLSIFLGKEITLTSEEVGLKERDGLGEFIIVLALLKVLTLQCLM